MVDQERIELYRYTDANGTATRQRPAGANYNEPHPLLRARDNSLLDPMFSAGGDLYFTATYDSAIGKALYRLQPSLGVNAGSKTLTALTISPNPSNGVVTLQTSDARPMRSISVTDVAGKLIHTVAVASRSEARINLTSVPPGIYTISVETSSGTMSQQLILQK
jgi:hypothetical protein